MFVIIKSYKVCKAIIMVPAAAAKSLSVVSDSVRPHRQQPTRLCRPWDSPGKSTGVGCHCLLQCMKEKSESEVVQSCPTLHDPMDCSPPGSSVHGSFQARILEWGAIAFCNNGAWDPTMNNTFNSSFHSFSSLLWWLLFVFLFLFFFWHYP